VLLRWSFVRIFLLWRLGNNGWDSSWLFLFWFLVGKYFICIDHQFFLLCLNLFQLFCILIFRFQVKGGLRFFRWSFLWFFFKFLKILAILVKIFLSILISYFLLLRILRIALLHFTWWFDLLLLWLIVLKGLIELLIFLLFFHRFCNFLHSCFLYLDWLTLHLLFQFFIVIALLYWFVILILLGTFDFFDLFVNFRIVIIGIFGIFARFLFGDIGGWIFLGFLSNYGKFAWFLWWLIIKIEKIIIILFRVLLLFGLLWCLLGLQVIKVKFIIVPIWCHLLA
jgi:hypothetical protein